MHCKKRIARLFGGFAMKCSTCGHWNHDYLPRCFRCGSALAASSPHANTDADWKALLQDAEPGETYIEFDPDVSTAQIASSGNTAQEVLGREIDVLKERRNRGELQLAHLRQQARRAKASIATAAIIRPQKEEDAYDALLSPQPVLDLQSDRTANPGRHAYATDQASSSLNTPRRSRRSNRPAQTDEQDNNWRGQTAAAWKAQEEFRYTEDEEAPVLYDGYTPFSADREFHARGMDPDPMLAEREKAAWTASRHPAVSTTFARGKHQTMLPKAVPLRKPRTNRKHIMLVQWAAIGLGVLAVCAAVLLGVNQLMSILTPVSSAAEEIANATIAESRTLEGLPAHTIWIPGKENTQIYIKELQKSYVVTGGTAEIQVVDYFWYDHLETYLHETMEVVLTPSIRYTSGEQQEMALIRYTINVPLSNVRLIRPESLSANVSTSIFDLRLQVDKGSRVIINGSDVTDLVDANGRVTKNVPVQDIGENRIQVSVRSKYCRVNNQEIVLIREAQEIPLEMAPDTLSESNNKSAEMTLYASTVPGATVQIESPHKNLNIGSLSTNGTFSFDALLTKIGDNEVIIRASQPGKRDSVMTHVIYYVPPVDEYSKKAWPFDRPNYLDLINNNELRKGTVYVCKGVIKEIISERPQLAIMDTNPGGDSQELLVMLENNTKTTWELNTYYRIYGDAFGIYDKMPSIIARYTYLD